MFIYYLRLAWLSMKQNIALNLLMVGAIGLGIGVFMSAITVYTLMSADPIPEKSNLLFVVRIDNWNPEEAYQAFSADDASEENNVPPMHTYKDAMALRKSTVPLRQAAMYKGRFIIEPDNESVVPYDEVVRMTDRDFFAMFSVPFIYGSVWDKNSDQNGEHVVVIAKKTNDKLFGGENSVGREIKMGEHRYTVTGVTDSWHPTPLFYDLNNGPFNDPEYLFMPFSIIANEELDREGNTNGWKRENINTHEEFLNSELIWIQYWAELPNDAKKEEYMDWLDAYVEEQQKFGFSCKGSGNGYTLLLPSGQLGR